MAKEWYGSFFNRLEENKNLVDEIKVGTGMTEYLYTDRRAYEVVEVKDQKHVKVRELDHEHVGDFHFDNNWVLFSNEENPILEMTKRGKYWCFTKTLTIDDIKGIDEDFDFKVRVVLAGFDIDKIKEKGKQTKYNRANVSFGHADYYYDYEF